MAELPILEGANTFFWIVSGLIGVLTAISLIDATSGDKKEEDKAH